MFFRKAAVFAVLFAGWACPAWAVLNNGFETDYIYALGRPNFNDKLKVIAEANGAVITNDLLAEGSSEHLWESLTFSGVGINDARLFVAKASGGNDIKICELNSSGQTVNTASLASLVSGGIGTNVPGYGASIRFSKSHPDSLFVSSVATQGDGHRGRVWEVNLGLTTHKATYTGPTSPNPDPDNNRTVMIALDDVNGTLYMTGRHLNRATIDGLGDVVAFDTSAGSTSTYTTLIHGALYDATDPTWYDPQPLVYRRSNPTDGTPTLLVGQLGPGYGWVPVLEFYLDTTAHPVDANGNLQRRGSILGYTRWGWSGQHDDLSGSAWWGGLTGGVHQIKADDTRNYYDISPFYLDADSPTYVGPLPPAIIDPPNPDYSYAGQEYIRQLVLSQGASVTWSLEQGAPGAVISETGQVSGWTPGETDWGDSFTFVVRVSNDAGEDTATWTVIVPRSASNNGFRTDYVYVARATGDDRITSSVRVHRKIDGEQVAQWAVGPWTTLTFSGEGRNDDARLFVADATDMLPDDVWHGTDIRIGELDANGATLKTVKLSQLLGESQVGPKVQAGNIRYNQFHNTLIVSAQTNVGTMTPAKAWEIDLDLSTLIHTYVGPMTMEDRPVNTAFDERTGKLYMGSRSLGEPSETLTGDLVALDTAGRVAGGTTTTYTTVIDGPTMNTTDSAWVSPHAPIYRAGDPMRDDGSDTILALVGNSSSARQVFEAWLDTSLHPADENGNLARRSQAFSHYLGFNGQQDFVTGEVWVASFRNGFSVLYKDDTAAHFQSGWDWWDIDTPPFQACNAPAVDADADGDVDQQDFAAFQLCYTGADTGASLTLKCECLDLGDDNTDGYPDRDGDIDSFDFTAFQACTTGPNVPFDVNNPPAGCTP